MGEIPSVEYESSKQLIAEQCSVMRSREERVKGKRRGKGRDKVGVSMEM